MTRIAACLLTIAAASPAVAGTWDLFVTRCLTPMEEIALEQPGDLTADAQFKNDGDTYATYKTAKTGAVLSVSDGRDGRPQWCRVHLDDETGEASAEIANSFLAWSSGVADDQYEEIEGDSERLTLRSTEWREPKLDVSMRMGPNGAGITLEARETDLEG